MARIGRRSNGPTSVTAHSGCCISWSKSRRCCQPYGQPSIRHRVDCCISRWRSSTGPALSSGARNIHIRCRRGGGPRTGLVLQHELDCELEPIVLRGGRDLLRRHVGRLKTKFFHGDGGLLASKCLCNAGRLCCVGVERLRPTESRSFVEVVEVVGDLAYHISM